MFSQWFHALQLGLSRTLPDDRLGVRRIAGTTTAKLKNLWPVVARHWRKGISGVCLLLFSSLLTFPQPLIFRYIVDDVILKHQLSLLIGAIALLIVIKAGSVATGMFQKYYFARFEQSVLLDLQHSILTHTLRLPQSFFDEKEVGYLMSRLLSDIQGLRWFFSSTSVYILSNMFRLLGGALVLLYLEWRLALAALVLLPGLFVGARYFSQKLYILGHQDMERHAQVSKRMQESLSASSLIKTFASEQREVDGMMLKFQESFRVTLERIVVDSVAYISINGVSESAKLATLAFGAVLVIAECMSLGSLLAFQTYLEYVYGPAQFLASANLQFQNALAALERISALFDLVPEDNGEDGIQVEQLQGDIAFEHLSFAYAQHEPVLEDVSCHIKAGEHVALVGPSGVGKTTFVSLILQLYKPTHGEISIDGLQASAYNPTSLRRRIGYVSQHTHLLSGTISENLRYGNPGASMETVIQAAQTAGIHDFIIRLPNGYESHVGERGLNLSQGQQQRLSLARALVKQPDILILDEPTSALDSLTERAIFETLPEVMRGKTMFVVAHRLSTVRNADRIFLLNEQRLIAIGTHQELLTQNAYYRTLVENQQILSV